MKGKCCSFFPHRYNIIFSNENAVVWYVPGCWIIESKDNEKVVQRIQHMLVTSTMKR